MYVQADVWIGDRDVRTFPGLFPELVYDGIFYFVSHKARVAEFLRIDNRINRESLPFLDILGPVDFLDLLIHFIRRACLEVLDRF